IAKFGTDFATGYVIEYTGEAIRMLTMGERMTSCNMSTEAGARAGIIAPDGTHITDIAIDRVFIVSCTNGRIEDLRTVAKVAKGYKVSSHVNAMIVPGSQAVKLQAEREGLDQFLLEAGFEWRDSGCSMCLG